MTAPAAPVPADLSALDLTTFGQPDDDATAVVHCDGRLSHGELRSAVDRCRTALSLPAKALVAIEAPRTVVGLIGYLGALAAGHAVVLVEEEWPDLESGYRPDLFVTTRRPAPAGLEQVGDDPVPVWRRPGPAIHPPIHPHLALLARTSGTLGPPKAVRLSYANLRTNAVAIATALGLRPSDRAMTSLPLDFSFGLSLVNSAFAAGASVALGTCSASSAQFWRYLHHSGGTCVGAVPATLAFLRSTGWDPAEHPGLRLLLHAGGALDPVTRAYHAQRMAAAGGGFVSMYGQTEATARISYLPPALASVYPGSVGRAVPNGRITIEAPGGESVPEGTVGEIVFAGPGVMLGYATGRVDLAAAGQHGAVLRTGDLGYLRDGLLFVTGRVDRQVKVFGRRINLDQVERWLVAAGHPAAVELDAEARLVVLAEPAAGLREACRTLARELGLPATCVRPHSVGVVPHNTRGKIDRRAVRSLIDPTPHAVTLLRQWVDNGECLGGQLFAWRDGQILTDVALGRSGPDREAAPDDVARLYCAVKPLMACCLASAVDTGVASFDDPASRFVPDFVADGRADITLRQLLSHTSGLPDFYLNPYEVGFDELVRIACHTPLPDSSWYRAPRYNDLLAWNVLAAAVERAHGAGFADVVAKAVAGPAGLPGLRMSAPDPERYVRCHRPGPQGFTVLPEPAEEVLFTTVNPAHGGFASARDLGLFYAALVRDVTGDGTPGLGQTRELIREQALVDLGMGLGQRTFGLGFVTGAGRDGVGGGWSDASFGHAGYAGRYRVVHGFGDPEHRIAVAIRLFSVGAKNNWRFHRLGAAIWNDIGPAADGQAGSP